MAKGETGCGQTRARSQPHTTTTDEWKKKKANTSTREKREPSETIGK